MYTGLTADEIRITGHDGDEINAYVAHPHGTGPFPAVAVIHHMPGWDEETIEAANRFAAHGYLAIVPNLHFRDAPGAAPDDAAAASRAAGGVPDERFLGDLAGAIAYLRSQPASNQKVGVIGYCSGGRQAFLAACSSDIDAAVDCYGGFVVGDVPEGMPRNLKPILHLAPQMRCPLLGLFGEVGSLLSALKKKQRDRTSYLGYEDSVIEEFGDVLWYFSNIAARANLDLNALAHRMSRDLCGLG